jgi:LysM repeat protein
MSTNCPTGTIAYTIVAGDTLYSLAIRYNTSVQQILSVNPNIDPNFLRIGQVICIPSRQPTPPCTGTLYTIRAGDTFYAIAIRNNITVNALIAANPGVNPNALRIGQVICIPRAVPPPGTCLEGSFAYTIRAGDTLYALANRYDTTVDAILQLNPSVDPNSLRVGQIICIPERPTGICPPNTFVYTIRAGDNFYQLAIRYNTTVSAIRAANPGVNPNRLQIGQRICIPR